MKIKNILRSHLENLPKDSGLCLPKNLGDGYLYNKNKIYREVREAAASCGFKYSDAPHDFYSALPLSQLEGVLASKTLPFQNNVDVLVKTEMAAPNQIEWDHVCDGLKQNHVFHESAHAIARTLAKRLRLDESKNKKDELGLVLVLLEESFANTCELLGIADVDDSLHRIFYETNSYFTVFEDKTFVKKALAEFSFAAFFKFVLLCYFHANFLKESLDDKEFQRISELAFAGVKSASELTSQNKKSLRALARNAFALNPRFRQVTTSFYLKMNGYQKETSLAFRFDHLKVLESEPSLKKYLDQLANFQKSVLEK